MPSAVSPAPRPTTEHDELDDLLNFDSDHDRAQNQQRSNSIAPEMHQPSNLDEEIKVTKQRKPIAKLDENRLLSKNGVPKLRKISKDRLKFRGKGTEFSDMARILNMYQLWLDDLFPKVKFVDGLDIIEKLGHKKRIQIMRKEWINEGKPKPAEDEEEDDGFVIPEVGTEDALTGRSTENHEIVDPSGAAGETRRHDNEEMSGALPQADRHSDSPLPSRPESQGASAGVASNGKLQEEPDEDELDALLAEDAAHASSTGHKSIFGGPTPASNRAPQQEQPPENFDDDEEAMMGMEW